LRRRADIVFARQKIAVYVDGCFWHSCPVHGTTPKTNREWWLAKLTANAARDLDTKHRLQAAGWTAIRIWEHQPVDAGIGVVEGQLRNSQEAPRSGDDVATDL